MDATELIRRQAEAVNSRNAEAFAAEVHEDVEWEDPGFWTEEVSVYRGRAGVRE